MCNEQFGGQPLMYVYICTVDYLRPPSLQISSCSSLHQLVGARDTGGKPSLILCRMVRGKGKFYFYFIAKIGRYLFRLWRCEQCSVCTYMLAHVPSIYEYSMYPIISMWPTDLNFVVWHGKSALPP
jgi:hypothetical protein